VNKQARLTFFENSPLNRIDVLEVRGSIEKEVSIELRLYLVAARTSTNAITLSRTIAPIQKADAI
jgi:hypothetical protein